MSPGKVIRGLVDPKKGKPLLKVVTGDSTAAESEHHENKRMPVIEDPIFSAEPVEVIEPPSPQGELFGATI